MKKLLGLAIALAMMIGLAKPFTVLAQSDDGGYGDVPPALPVDVIPF